MVLSFDFVQLFADAASDCSSIPSFLIDASNGRWAMTGYTCPPMTRVRLVVRCLEDKRLCDPWSRLAPMSESVYIFNQDVMFRRLRVKEIMFPPSATPIVK